MQGDAKTMLGDKEASRNMCSFVVHFLKAHLDDFMGTWTWMACQYVLSAPSHGVCGYVITIVYAQVLFQHHLSV